MPTVTRTELDEIDNFLTDLYQLEITRADQITKPSGLHLMVPDPPQTTIEAGQRVLRIIIAAGAVAPVLAAFLKDPTPSLYRRVHGEVNEVRAILNLSA